MRTWEHPNWPALRWLGAKLTKCSQDSANRDIATLLEYGLLDKGPGGGQSTHYVITGAFGMDDIQ